MFLIIERSMGGCYTTYKRTKAGLDKIIKEAKLLSYTIMDGQDIEEFLFLEEIPGGLLIYTELKS